MEGCHSQGPTGVNANITLSNNPPTDLAFAKRTLRNLLRYSKVLGVDQERRAAWKDALENIAPYPLVKDEDGETVLAQATGDGTGDGFPQRRCSPKDEIHSPGCFQGLTYGSWV
jgi:hypothetical protein